MRDKFLVECDTLVILKTTVHTTKYLSHHVTALFETRLVIFVFYWFNQLEKGENRHEFDKILIQSDWRSIPRILESLK